jgi:hypothetical protein
MPRVSLTDRFVASARTIGDDPQTDFFDAVTTGLVLRVSDTAKSWNFSFSLPDRKRARMTLGTYPAMPLSVARTKAIEARGHVEDGTDPRSIVQQQHSASQLTVAEIFARYVSDPDKAQLRSLHEIRRRFTRDILPIIGHIRLSDLTRRDVKDCTDKIMRRGSRTQAWHTHKNIRAALNWAVANDFIPHNPIAQVEAPGGFNVCERTLSDDEIYKLWHGLPTALARSINCQRILRLCLVTGQRVGEVSGLVRSELDLKRKLWTLPARASRMGINTPFH